MDIQHAALSKIILNGDLTPFIESRINRDFFPDAEHARIWDMVLEHYQQYGKPPSPDAVHLAYPRYAFTEYEEPTEFFLNQLRQDRQKVLLTAAMQEFSDRLQEDEGPSIGDELADIIRKGLANAAHEVSQGRDTDFFPSYDRIMEKLRERRQNPGVLRGISTGLAGMDYLTGGFQNEQLICLVGTPKAGKSSMLLKMALNAKQNGVNVLFLTFEMSTEEQEDRLVSLLSGVGLTKILNGTFSSDEEKRIDKALLLRKDNAGLVITSDTTSAVTLSGVQAKIIQYQPALVIVDGVYLMDDEAGNDKGTPQALTSITRGFKRLAQTMRIPVVISTQAMLYRAKKGLKMDSVGYSSSFVQDSDIVFGVEAHESIPGVSKFHVLASRSSPRGEAFVRFDWGQGLIEEMTDEEYERAMNAYQPMVGSKNAPAATDESLWGDEDVA